MEASIVGVFGLVAMLTGHEHWLKEKEEVVPITGPLNAWIETLPVKTLKKIEKNIAPALLAVGVTTVIGPDIILEARLRAYDKSNAPAVPRQRQTGVPFNLTPPDSGADGHRNGSQHAPGADWYAGIPSVAAQRIDGYE